GGTGETFDWELVRQRRTDVPFVLSGGLSPDNVAAAIEATHPYAVDTASGTEARPGVKDPEKLRAFAAAVGSTVPAPAPAVGAARWRAAASSTASRRRPCARGWGSSASSTWAPRTSAASSPTCSG